jgi:hypothetical protein
MSLADGLKGDSVTIADKTSAKSIFPIDDTASVDDSISKRVFYEIGDAVTTIDDSSTNFSKFVYIVITDAVTINDITKDLPKFVFFVITDSMTSRDFISSIADIAPQPPSPPPDKTPKPSGHGKVGVGPTSSGASGPSGSSISRIEGELPEEIIHKVTYNVCNENISRTLVGYERSVPPSIQLLYPQLGLVEETLLEFQPYSEDNKNEEISRYIYDAPLGAEDGYFTIYAVDHQSNEDSTFIQVEECEGTIFFVDDNVVLPEIFDIKYNILNSTINPDTAGYHYIDENTILPVSAIVDSPIVSLKRAELHVVPVGEPAENATVLPMDVTPLILPLDETDSTSIITAIIPAELVQATAVEFWIYLVTAEGLVKKSIHHVVAVRPDGYSGEFSVEMDTTTIKAQGTTLRPVTYVTSTSEMPVYGDLSLVVDGKTTVTKQVLLEPGQNIIDISWKIPKTDSMTQYDIQSKLELYEDTTITSEATINAYVRTEKMALDGALESISYVTDEAGNAIARPALLYASIVTQGVRFHVTAPDGTCVIGGEAGCLVNDSTTQRRGGLDSVIIDRQIYGVRYSGADNILERFSITSSGPIVGNWKVHLESAEIFGQSASAQTELWLKVKYRAEHNQSIIVSSD